MIVGHRLGNVHGSELYGAAGQLLYSTASGRTVVTAAPAAGTSPRWDGTALTFGASLLQQNLPTGGLVENFPRVLAASNISTTLTSGTLFMLGIPVLKGMVISTLSYWSGTTALATGSNQWAALFTSARVKVAISADATNAAWAANTRKNFAMTAPYTVTADGILYAGLLVVASTTPTLQGLTNGTANGLAAEAPILYGTADASLTNPASCPSTAAAITAGVRVPYVLAS